MNFAQYEPHPFVESTRCHVDVLRLDLEPFGAMGDTPRLDGRQQRSAHALTAHGGRDTDVPQECDVLPAAKHVHVRRAKDYGRSSNPLTSHASREESPAR